MSSVQMREKVAQFYPGPKWKARVARMSDAEVRLINQIKETEYGERTRTNQGGVSEQQEVGGSR